jgi:hypothetical protein
MPDWNRIIVGDAFKLPSHDLNYYRDLFLIWPFLLCSVVGITQLYAPVSPAGRNYGFKVAACAVFTLLLAKEKRILILVASLYVGFRLAIRLVLGVLFLRHDWATYLPGFLVSAVVVFMVIRSSIGRRPSYTRNSVGKMRIVSLLVVMCSLGCTIALLRWINP